MGEIVRIARLARGADFPLSGLMGASSRLITYVLMATVMVGTVFARFTANAQSGLPSLPSDTPAIAYDLCLDQAEHFAERAIALAQGWELEGGGNAARHCQAVAHSNLGNHRPAAILLDTLAGDLATVGDPLAGELFGEAGRAWLLAGQPQMAGEALDSAITALGASRPLLTLRAYAHAGLQEYWQAIETLTQALALGDATVELLLLRAAAYRHLEVYELALDDLGRGMAMAPDDPELLLERGNIHALSGDTGAAIADWSRVVEVAPETGLAQTAERNIARVLAPDLG